MAVEIKKLTIPEVTEDTRRDSAGALQGEEVLASFCRCCSFLHVRIEMTIVVSPQNGWSG